MLDERESVMARAVDWLLGGDAGLSSRAILRHMVGQLVEAWDYPGDLYDFGRCVRLLDRFPEWQDRVGEMAEYGEGWAGVVNRWEALLVVYRQHARHGDRDCPEHRCYHAWHVALAEEVAG